MWTTLEIAGKTADVFDPPGDARPRFGLLFLHGIGLETLAGSPAYSRFLDMHRISCICPHGKRSWWVDRVCAEFDPALTPEKHLLGNVVPIFEQRWQLRPGRIALFGISMGGQGALRLGFKYPKLFPVVAGIAAALDFHDWYGQGTPLDEMYDSKEQCRQDTTILHVHPTEFPPHIYFCVDPDDRACYRGNDRLHEKLASLGITHQVDFTTRAGGHSWQYFEHMAERTIAFLVAGLEKESRRLL
jgi:S-formylglutathione hydrolase